MAQPVDLSRIPIRFVLEMYVGDAMVRAVTLPSQPQRAQVSPVHAGSVAYTLGDRPDRQHTPRRRWTLDYAGHTGIADRQATTRTGSVAKLSGGQTLIEFDEFLAYYQRTASDFGSSYIEDPDGYRELRDYVYLVCRDFDAKVHLKVEVPQGGWSFTRSVQSARLGSFDWQLSMQGYAEATPTKAPAVLGSLSSAKTQARSLVADATAQVSKINTAIGKAQGGVGSAERELSRLRVPLQRLTLATQQARLLIQSAASVAAFPRRVLLDVAVMAEQSRAAFQDVISAGYDFRNSTTAAARRLQAAFSATEDLSRDSLTAYGKLRGGSKERATATASALTGATQNAPSGTTGKADPTSATAYTLKPGDTLKTVAKDLLGNSALWTSIAAYNGLADGYHSAAGAPLAPGDVVLVPGAQTPGADLPSLQAGDLYGTDLYLDQKTGDLVLDGTSGVYQTGASAFTALPAEPTDLLTVSGDDNLKQSIYNKMRTPRGAVAFWSKYGLLQAPGSAMGAQEAYIAADAREQVLRDPRIADVTDLVVTDNGDGRSVEMTVQPVNSATIGVVAAA